MYRLPPMPVATKTIEFQLTEWRRPFRAVGWSNLAQFPLAVGFAGFLAIGALAALSVPPRLAVPLGVGLTVACLAAIMAIDFRKHPAGTLKLQDGRILFSAWAGRTWNVPVEDVRVSYFKMDGGPVLKIILKGAPSILVHQARVTVSLEAIQAALLAQLGGSRNAEPRPATTRETFILYGQLVRSRWPVLVATVALCALMVWLSSRLH